MDDWRRTRLVIYRYRPGVSSGETPLAVLKFKEQASRRLIPSACRQLLVREIMRSCGSCFRVRGHEAAGNRGRVGPKTARTTLWRLEAGLKRGQAEFMQGIAACTYGLARAMRQKKRGAEAIVGRGWVQRCRSWLRIRSDLRARVRCASLAGRASASADKPDDPVGASSTKAFRHRAS